MKYNITIRNDTYSYKYPQLVIYCSLLIHNVPLGEEKRGESQWTKLKGTGRLGKTNLKSHRRRRCDFYAQAILTPNPKIGSPPPQCRGLFYERLGSYMNRRLWLCLGLRKQGEVKVRVK